MTTRTYRAALVHASLLVSATAAEAAGISFNRYFSDNMVLLTAPPRARKGTRSEESLHPFAK
jgi:hypothetical protein